MTRLVRHDGASTPAQEDGGDHDGSASHHLDSSLLLSAPAKTAPGTALPASASELSMDTSSHNAAFAAAALKRSRAHLSAEERWNKMTVEHVWIDTSTKCQQAWLTHTTVHCKPCNKVLNLSSNYSNVDIHEKTKLHKDNTAALHGVGLQRHLNSHAPPQGPMYVRDARALLTLSSCRFVPPSNIHKMYSGSHGKIAEMLIAENMQPSSETTSFRDLRAGEELMEAAICDEVARCVGMTVHVDEASSKLAGRGRPLGVIVESAELEFPIMIDLIWDLHEVPSLDAVEKDSEAHGGEGVGGARGTREVSEVSFCGDVHHPAAWHK